jgi:hypothetical protein
MSKDIFSGKEAGRAIKKNQKDLSDAFKKSVKLEKKDLKWFKRK